ncbi:MAG: RimK family alpha-L-glutamate ligase [Phycisphaeraceae bacterium]|nr:RimK family alpha-L-glutamate ligase [Phycisphaeraceae bacterium]MCB9847159.1 RimK family alpha-L-glutamate ligase [Phycisphaeraceae bacterium]
MKIGILSRAEGCYSTRRLAETARDRGHEVEVLDTLRFSIQLSDDHPSLYYKDHEMDDFDAIIPRIGASITHFGASVLRQLEQMDVFCITSSNGLLGSRDKLRAMQSLSRQGVGIADTAFVRDRRDILAAIERVGGAPVVIKLLEGTQGVGVILAETQKVAEAIIETLQSANQNVLLQKFVAESRGKDIRAFVVGNRVVAAMRRTAQGQEFRSNVHRGGVAESVDLDPVYRKTAIRAAHLLGLRVAGVDMLEGADGPKVMEVNSSPGLQGIEGATGVDVAGAVIELVEDQVMFPELDIRQRLSVAVGYGASELFIPEDSPIVGKTLAESHLRDRDVVVLSLERDDVVIPNPRGERVIMAGDRLLCFGKQSEMRSLIPPRKPGDRQRRPVSTSVNSDE